MHPAERYVNDVLDGKITACRYVIAACQRHKDDLENGHKRGLYFDEKSALVAIAFVGLLKHWKGEWAGTQITLEPWQQFIVWSLFGWKREDGARRFQTVYLEVARKNGKTTFAAAIGLYLMTLDGEPGAEVYSAATKRDQAKIVFSDASMMVKQSGKLQKLITVYKNNLSSTKHASKFEPLSADYNSLDGLNAHGVIADELHAWPGTGLWGVLKTSMGSRRQPVMLSITTAGIDQQGVCYLQREYVHRILTGVVEDDAYFGIIYTLDVKRDWPDLDEETEDRWDDESVWQKANPNLGISKKWRSMRSGAREARAKPSELNNFMRWHLNLWVQASERWVNPVKWAACDAPLPDLTGRVCYGGLDLSNTQDITALVLVFPPLLPEEPYYILPRFWIPHDAMLERARDDNVPYVTWHRQELIHSTPGNIVDYSFVMAQLEEDRVQYDLKEVAFDRWGSQKIVTDLQDMGFTIDQKEAQLYGKPLLVQFGQGYASMSGPMKELESLYLSESIAHDGHPVLSWMADNVVAKQDPAGNIKPDKSKSREKIDGIVALIMGLARAIAHAGDVSGSVYRQRGIRTL